MSSKFEDIQSALGSPCGQYFHGESVTHWPEGLSGSETTVDDVIFEELSADGNEERTGKRIVRKACLLVPDSLTLKKSDAWVIDSETWQTESMGVSVGGLREVYLVMTEQIKTESNAKARGKW